MGKFFHKLSALFLFLALADAAALLIGDGLSLFRPTAVHQHMGALSFMFIGVSYICIQLSAIRDLKTKLKQILLGGGFLLWGSEQFLPPGPWVTVIDATVVIIFVADLSLIIVESLRHAGQ